MSFWGKSPKIHILTIGLQFIILGNQLVFLSLEAQWKTLIAQHAQNEYVNICMRVPENMRVPE